MFAKIEITGNIEVLTGMHIGGSNSYSAIGTVDSPVIGHKVWKSDHSRQFTEGKNAHTACKSLQHKCSK